MPDRLRLVFIGLSITSSWGNGHATNYRALLRALHARGHDVLFLERDVSWYRDTADMPEPSFARLGLYKSLSELRAAYRREIASADAVVLGSFVPEGHEVSRWVHATAKGITAFYDIDTPVTLAKLERGDHEYLSPDVIPGFDLYLSFTGGPTLRTIERRYGSPRARAFYCLVDPDLYRPDPSARIDVDLGYIGTYSDDRQPALERLLIEPARRAAQRKFAVAGPQYPETIEWPGNVERIEHLPPSGHRAFYCGQRFTLNITRADMVRAGYSPSVRLFEAAACGTPIISDRWSGIETIFRPGEEILLADTAGDVLSYLRDISDAQRARIAAAARRRVLAEHTAGKRAEQFLDLLAEAKSSPSPLLPVETEEPMAPITGLGDRRAPATPTTASAPA